MSIINFYFKNAINAGDRASAPGLYFTPAQGAIDLADICEREHHQPTGVILGGGALVTKLLRRQLGFHVPTVIWGAGYTVRVEQRFISYRLPEHYQLIGVRDVGTPYEWVPCASCLSPLFDQQYPVTREFVVYENTQHAPLKDADLGNGCLDFPKIIATLGSAETVITSSYHGAYWATLLGRRVVAVPFGSKFYGMKHPPKLAMWADWHKQPGNYYPEALAECRAANHRFAERVWDALNPGR